MRERARQKLDVWFLSVPIPRILRGTKFKVIHHSNLFGYIDVLCFSWALSCSTVLHPVDSNYNGLVCVRRSAFNRVSISATKGKPGTERGIFQPFNISCCVELFVGTGEQLVPCINNSLRSSISQHSCPSINRISQLLNGKYAFIFISSSCHIRLHVVQYASHLVLFKGFGTHIGSCDFATTH